MPADAHRAARVAAVLRQRLELGDLALAFEPRRMVHRERLDQPPDPVAYLQREVRRRSADQGANVLGGELRCPPEQRRVLCLAHGPLPPILASSARLSISACCSTDIASWSPI